MSERPIGVELLHIVHAQWRTMLAVAPGLALVMLHSTALDLPKADVIDALDTDVYRVQWINGAYLLGSAVGMALTQFAGQWMGLRRAYLMGLVGFALGSFACAGVSEILWIAPLRLIQGLGGGLAISVGMVIVWRAFPQHKELAMAVYGMAVYLPALAGVPFGGLLTAWFSWRAIFFINLPLAVAMAALASWALPEDRPAAEHAGKFDWFGLALLAAMIVCGSVVLDMGQYWGWFNSPRFVPWFVAMVLSVAAFTAWGVWASRPLINLRPLAIRNFALGLSIKILFSINLYVLVAVLSGYMIDLRSYQWWQGSLVIAPGAMTMFLTVLAGAARGTHANRKPRMLAGLAVMALATWWFANIDLYTSKFVLAAHLALWSAGAGLVVGPALLTIFEGMTNDETLATAGLFNVARSLPTFVAGSLLATLLVQHIDENFDWLRLDIAPNRPIVTEALDQAHAHFVGRGAGRAVAARQSHALIGQWTQANARAMAVRDVLELLALAPTMGLILTLAIRVPSGDLVVRSAPAADANRAS